MNKKLLLFSALLGLFLGCNKNTTEKNIDPLNNLKQHELIGDVKEVFVAHHTTDGSSKPNTVALDYRLLFDESGVLTLKEIYNHQGKIAETSHFNSDGNLIKVIKYLNGNVLSITNHIFNENGLEHEVIKEDSQNNILERTIKEYQDTLLTKITKLKSNGNIESVTKFSYNEKNLITDEKYYLHNGSLLVRTKTYSYDDSNRLIKEIETDKDDHTVYYIEYAHDPKNLTTIKRTYDTQGNLNFRETTTVDQHQNILKFLLNEFAPDNELIEEYTYTTTQKISSFKRTNNSTEIINQKRVYNEYDHLINIIHNNDSIEKINYHYDENGNWIEKDFIKNGTPLIIKRTITYF